MGTKRTACGDEDVEHSLTRQQLLKPNIPECPESCSAKFRVVPEASTHQLHAQMNHTDLCILPKMVGIPSHKMAQDDVLRRPPRARPGR